MQNRLRPIYMVAMFLLPTICPAQSYTKQDSLQIYMLLDKADQESVTGSLDKAKFIAEEALQLSRQKRMLRGQGFAELKVADIKVQQSEEAGLLQHFSNAQRIATTLRDTFMLALGYYQLGQHHLFRERLDSAEWLFQRALGTYFEKQQSSYTASIYNDIGFLHGQRDEFEKEAMWYLKALRVHEKTEDLNGMAITTNNLANVYHHIGNREKAFSFAREAVAMREKLGDIQGMCVSYENLSRMFWEVSLDSASKYQQLAMKYAEKTGLKNLMMSSYDNLSVLMDKRRNKPEALRYINMSIALCRESGDKGALANKLRWAAILTGDLKDTVGMEKLFAEVYDLTLPMNNKRLLRDFYASKASSYRKLGDFKTAYGHLEKFYAYRDSVVRDETATNIAELQTRYDTEKKDNEIARLNTQERIRQLEIEKQKAIISGNRLEAERKQNEITLLSQQQELSDNRIRQQAEELEKQALVARNNKQQLQLATQEREITAKQIQNQRLIRNILIGGLALLAILGWVLFNRYQLKKKVQQQQELLAVRSHIARDLHDEIGSTLTSIKILSQVSQNNLHKDQQKTSSLLEKITEQSAQMQQGMSDIVWAIKPDNDRMENMLIRMREYIAHTLEPHGIETFVEADERALAVTLDMQQRKDLFLIFKEAVNNTVKYAQATRVDIAIRRESDKLILLVRDNGIGFARKEKSSSNGLDNMQSRAASWGGHVEISTQTGQGTTVRAEVPAT